MKKFLPLLLVVIITAFSLNNISRTGKGNEQVLITIKFNENNPVNTIIPNQSIGGAIDGHEKGDNEVMMSTANIRKMLSSGLDMLSYRLRTELGIEAWHWNPAGHWSDSLHNNGYWISDSISDSPINLSYGFYLPRRGSTFDQANNDGYSRIDDGDHKTFWKSNPYIDSYFTGNPNSAHEQWVGIDLGKKQNVNQLEIDWADPYAVDLRLEYAEDESVSQFNHVAILNPYAANMWKPLPVSTVHLDHGGKTLIRLSDRPVNLRVLRIVFIESSHTALMGSHDKRDSCGYAIREIKLGLKTQNGFTNLIRYGKTNTTQTAIFASTTDPWHRPEDMDQNTEQPGIDFIFKSGLAGSQPALFSSGLIYDIPENALALVSYLKKKNYRISGLELGEEPDGQYISPIDFTELYALFARKIKKSNPDLLIGGPSFEGLIVEKNIVKQWPSQFLSALKKANELNLLQFMSFEWYPLDEFCLPSSPQLIKESQTLEQAIKELREGGLPVNLPIYFTESGYSVLAAEPEVRLEGALLNADVLAQFFELGGNKIFIYGWEPSYLINENKGCGGYGNLEFFGLDKNGQISFATGLFFSTWLCTQKWAQPADKPLKVYKAISNLKDNNGNQVVTAYPLYTHDGKWSILLINKSDKKDYHINLNINNGPNGQNTAFSMNADLYQFSKKQYDWKANGEDGHPIRNNFPEARHLYAGQSNGIDLPAFSISVIRQR